MFCSYMMTVRPVLESIVIANDITMTTDSKNLFSISMGPLLLDKKAWKDIESYLLFSLWIGLYLVKL